jgi:DNA-binding MarR family transcriptional regulator
VQTEYSPEESIGYQLRRTSRKMSVLLKAALAEDRITIGMWYYLRALWERDGLIARELTEFVGTMQPTTVIALRNMKRRGLIRMQPDKQDNRRIRIFLTKEGHQLKQRLLPRVAAINNIVLSEVEKKDATVFARVIKKIQENAESAIKRLA